MTICVRCGRGEKQVGHWMCSGCHEQREMNERERCAKLVEEAGLEPWRDGEENTFANQIAAAIRSGE